MRALQYRKIDAFTSGDSLGNPAACVYLEKGETLSHAEMQSIARRHKGFVSEVVYCSPESRNEFNLAYYSSECEVDFCGHGTIACMYGLIKETPGLAAQKEITIHARKKGVLRVYNEIAARDAVYVGAPSPNHIGTGLERREVAERLALSEKQLSTAHPLDLIDAGLRTLIVPIAALSDEIGVFPDERTLKAFCEQNGIDIILIFSLDVQDKQNFAHTRVFAPKFGYLEDPATGSGNSAFGYYLLKNKLWDGTPATIEQGGEDREFNSVRLSTIGERVMFGGSAATRISGVYYL